MEFVVLVIFLHLLFTLDGSAAQEGSMTCFACNYNPNDRGCLTNPINCTLPGTVMCPRDWWCRTQRMEAVQNPGVIHDFFRTCIKEYLNYTDNQSVQYKTYFTSCQGDFCNSGNGIRNDGGGGGGIAAIVKINHFGLILLLAVLVQQTFI